MLCDARGRLLRESVGWSRRPMHTCNLPPELPRKKRWNYWCVTSGDLLFSATIADIDFVALAFVYTYERGSGRFIEKTVVAPSGSVALPQTTGGDIMFEHPEMQVELLDDGAGTRIRVRAADFRGVRLDANIAIARPAGHETLNVVIPWSDEEFQFTSKQNTLPATGHVAVGEAHYELSAPTYGCLDYGRGVWPHETLWNWGAASGVQALRHGLRRVIGLNLGGRWTDGTGMTENGFCIDGRLTKISEDLRFEYDRAHLMAPWRIRTAVSDRIDLTFTPVYERVSKADAGAYMSEVHHVFGHYAGRIVPDDSAAIELDGLFGWIEDHAARW